MKRLIALYLKELHLVVGFLLLVVVPLTVLGNLFLYFQDFWNGGASLGFSWLIVWGVAVVGGLAFAKAMVEEWRNRTTAHWLLSLPVSGYTILAAKFGLVLTFLLLSLLFAVGGFYCMLGWTHDFWISPIVLAGTYFYYLGIGILAAVLMLLASAAEFLVRRGKGLVFGGVFIGTIWAWREFISLMDERFPLLPAFEVARSIVWDRTGFTGMEGELSLATILAWGFCIAGSLLLTGYLLDRHAEV